MLDVRYVCMYFNSRYNRQYEQAYTVVKEFFFSPGEVSEIWNQFFKYKFFYVIFFAETSLGYLGMSPGPVRMVSWPQKGAIPGVQSFHLDWGSDFMHFFKISKGPLKAHFSTQIQVSYQFWKHFIHRFMDSKAFWPQRSLEATRGWCS